MTFSRIIAFVLAIFLAAPALAQGKTIIVLDGSGSMWGQIEGKTKIEIARETLSQVLTTVPAENELGLIVYGHREKGSCSDIELAVAPQQGTGGTIATFANNINPKGKTPLTQSVRMAADELKFEENKATVILVTDGLETCEADPCALASELEATGVDFTAHVVGFGLSDEEGRQVACLAENTGGLYLKAADAGQLAEALTTTVAQAPEPEPEPAPQQEPAAVEFNFNGLASLSADSQPLEGNNSVRWDLFPIGPDGKAADRDTAGGYGGVYRASVPAGRYLARVRLGQIIKETEVDLVDTEAAEVPVVLDAGIVTMIPRRTPEAEPDTNARVDAEFQGGDDGGYGPTTIYAAAGPVTIRGRIGDATAEESFELVAGETVEKDLVIGSGLVVPSAVYAEGGPAVEGNSIRFTILEAKADITGNRDEVAGQYGPGGGMDVPAGEYLMAARLGAAQGSVPVAVKAGERVEASIDINAGVLAISAPGAYRIEILGKKDIQGKQDQLSGGYGETLQETLHPGEYEILVTYRSEGSEETEKRQKASVKAGERTDTTIQ